MPMILIGGTQYQILDTNGIAIGGTVFWKWDAIIPEMGRLSQHRGFSRGFN